MFINYYGLAQVSILYKSDLLQEMRYVFTKKGLFRRGEVGFEKDLCEAISLVDLSKEEFANCKGFLLLSFNHNDVSILKCSRIQFDRLITDDKLLPNKLNDILINVATKFALAKAFRHVFKSRGYL